MKNDERNDELIIKEVLKGDSEIFGIIVKRYQSLIFSIGMRFFRNEDDAYDFVQEVFIKAFKKLEQFRAIAPFRFWLTRLAFNTGINRVKAYKNDGSLDDAPYLVSKEKGPAEAHLEKEARAALLEAIQRLPNKYRLCVDFYFFYGLSYNEISGITGFPVNTIKSHVFRAKRELYSALSGTAAEEYYENES